ncbi:MAG: hypothetical protein HY829_05200 [Actinobacteria bacterium]|nr:hypothetical protein [Actinomycetota bacterium]
MKQRAYRLLGSLALVLLGVQGLLSPISRLALARTMPDCLGADPVSAAVGLQLKVLAGGSDCPHGSYAPTPSYHLLAHAALTVSVTTLLLGVLAFAAAVGVGFRLRHALRQLRQWFARRIHLAVSTATSIVIHLGRPAMVPVVVRPVRTAARPHVRRGPPSCSC